MSSASAEPGSSHSASSTACGFASMVMSPPAALYGSCRAGNADGSHVMLKQTAAGYSNFVDPYDADESDHSARPSRRYSRTRAPRSKPRLSPAAARLASKGKVSKPEAVVPPAVPDAPYRLLGALSSRRTAASRDSGRKSRLLSAGSRRPDDRALVPVAQGKERDGPADMRNVPEFLIGAEADECFSALEWELLDRYEQTTLWRQQRTGVEKMQLQSRCSQVW